MSYLAGGWEVSTILSAQKGSPFGVTVANGARDLLGDPAVDKVLRPNIVGSLDLPAGQQGSPSSGQRGIQWFNTSAFAPPPRFTYGNAGRTVMLGPGLFNFDLGVMKNIPIGERYRLQFRWESFNASNTPKFGLPGFTLGAGGFGNSISASDREMQFALKLYF